MHVHEFSIQRHEAPDAIAELVQMAAMPAKGSLDEMVQLAQRAVAGHAEAPPYRWVEVKRFQLDMQGVQQGLGGHVNSVSSVVLPGL